MKTPHFLPYRVVQGADSTTRRRAWLHDNSSRILLISTFELTLHSHAADPALALLGFFPHHSLLNPPLALHPMNATTRYFQASNAHALDEIESMLHEDAT